MILRGIATAGALTPKPYSGPGAAGLGGQGAESLGGQGAESVRGTAGWASSHSENGPPTHDPAMEAAAHSPQIPVPSMVTGSRLTARADRRRSRSSASTTASSSATRTVTAVQLFKPNSAA